MFTVYITTSLIENNRMDTSQMLKHPPQNSLTFLIYEEGPIITTIEELSHILITMLVFPLYHANSMPQKSNLDFKDYSQRITIPIT